MVPKTALILLTLISPGLLVITMFGGAGLVWLGAPMICGLPLLLIVVGSHRRQPSRGALLAIWLLLSGSWLGLGWISSATDLAHPSLGEASTVMGLMLLGLGLLPLVLVAWIFVRTFSTGGLLPEDLQRLRKGRES